MKKNKIDLLIFVQPSFYSLYCDGVQFIINIWNTEIKKCYNLKEFINGGYEYQNKIINFALQINKFFDQDREFPILQTGGNKNILDLNNDQKNKIIANIPSNRLGTGEDISNGCIYLASDEASFITGTTLHINGGMSMI